jgi:methylmalonyl-CoA/ethylmalonyl-CoA epimerase
MEAQTMSFKVDHIGFIVRDVEKYAAMLTDYLEINDWMFKAFEPPILYEQTLDGENVDHSYKIAMGSFNGARIELLMPLKGESVYSQALKKSGESIHHICLAFPSEAERDQKKEELLKKGGRIIQSGKIKKPEGRAIYYYVEKDGVVLELMVKKE